MVCTAPSWAATCRLDDSGTASSTRSAPTRLPAADPGPGQTEEGVGIAPVDPGHQPVPAFGRLVLPGALGRRGQRQLGRRFPRQSRVDRVEGGDRRRPDRPSSRAAIPRYQPSRQSSGSSTASSSSTARAAAGSSASRCARTNRSRSSRLGSAADSTSWLISSGSTTVAVASRAAASSAGSTSGTGSRVATRTGSGRPGTPSSISRSGANVPRTGPEHRGHHRPWLAIGQRQHLAQHPAELVGHLVGGFEAAQRIRVGRPAAAAGGTTRARPAPAGRPDRAARPARPGDVGAMPRVSTASVRPTVNTSELGDGPSVGISGAW